MTDGGAGSDHGNDSAYPVEGHRPFRSYLRDDSVWSRPSWVFFCCALVFCTIQAVPSWTHPDLLVNWDVPTCLWIIAAAGAVTGLVVTRCRWAGLIAGAVAGGCSLLTAVTVFQGFDHFPRYAVVIVQAFGLLPGVALYWVLHTIADQGRNGNAHRDVGAR